MSISNPYGLHQEIRFCTTPDDVRIAYATMGSGPPLVKAANWLSHLEFDRKSPVWRHWLLELSRDHTLIRYDERGCGLSDWDVEFSLEAWVRDLEAVVDTLGLERFPLLGISQGGAVAVTYAVRHPERVSHLILYGAYAEGWRRREDPAEQAEREALQTLMRRGWGRDNPAYRQLFTSLFLPGGTPEQASWFNELQRISTSPDNAVRFQQTFGDIDVGDLLPRVTAPTLVLHARHDGRIPFEQGRFLASHIPGSRFVELESQNHLILEPEPAWADFVREVRAFLGVEPLERIREAPRGAASGAGAEAPGSGAPPAGPPGRAGVAGEEPLQVLNEALQGHYTLEAEVGRGGMATVYRAREHKHDRLVAVKVIHPELTVGEGAQRFQREIQITSQLQHPHIVPLLDSGVVNGLLYYVTPFIQGASLQAHMARGDATALETVVRIAGQVASGLDHAHRQGVVHRDIKPANVMISDGQAIVTDFGIAKALEVRADSDLTAAGAVLGTVPYMSPEQLTGGVVDARSDVFSLGCVTYELLAGRRPFTSPPGSYVSPLARTPAPDLSEVRPELPAHVSYAVRRAMDDDPGRRFPSAGAFASALAGAGDLGVGGRTTRTRIAVAVVVLAVLAAVLLFLL